MNTVAVVGLGYVGLPLTDDLARVVKKDSSIYIRSQLKTRVLRRARLKVWSSQRR